MQKEELLKGLSEEQIAKVKACKDQQELLELAKEEGIELSNEQLEAVNGGMCTTTGPKCPQCGSTRTVPDGGFDYKCKECKHVFNPMRSF